MLVTIATDPVKLTCFCIPELFQVNDTFPEDQVGVLDTDSMQDYNYYITV